LRVNIPVALAASMISNPLSMGPLYYGAYRLGLVVLGERPSVEAAPPLPDAAFGQLGEVLAPLLVGCGLFAVSFATLAWVLINWLWVSTIRRRVRQRAAARDGSGRAQAAALEREDPIHPPGDGEVVGHHD
jgi:hypothetical protein